MALSEGCVTPFALRTVLRFLFVLGGLHHMRFHLVGERRCYRVIHLLLGGYIILFVLSICVGVHLWSSEGLIILGFICR